jgi:hypothetical protein
VGRYRVIEEVALADCAFDLEGDDLNDLFATAARALAELSDRTRCRSRSRAR